MNTGNNNDKKRKCVYHPKQNLELLCLECNNIPICYQCSSFLGTHNGHKAQQLFTDEETEREIVKKMMNALNREISYTQQTIGAINARMKEIDNEVVDNDNDTIYCGNNNMNNNNNN